MPNGRPASRRILERGFTMLELMVVISVVLILLSMAAGSYRTSLRHAKESTLAHNLRTMRVAIEAYTTDKQAAPQSLQDLVSAGYLHYIPEDPITGRKDWVPVFEDVVLSPDQFATGLTSVRSASDLPSLKDGTPYSTW